MATLSDVARAAGVSTSTVSYVISGKRTISGETKARVEQAIQSLSYRPHAGARALASHRTEVLALVAPLRTDVDVHVIMEFVTGIVTRARALGHDVLLLTRDDAVGLERVSAGSMVDALIVMDIEAEDSRIPALVELAQPSVLIGLPHDPRGLSVVDLDFEAAGRLALRHLLDLGHRSIGLIGSTPTVLGRHTAYAERLLRGYGEEAEQAGLPVVFEPSEASAAGGGAATARVLDRLPGLSALVVHNEAALPGVVSALRDRGLRVPAEVSLLALCPADVARGQDIELTSIDLPATRIGELAVDMAVAQIRDGGVAEIRLIPPELRAGSSTAPAS